jgi:membrane protease YdiL (CAAX protease family)
MKKVSFSLGAFAYAAAIGANIVLQFIFAAVILAKGSGDVISYIASFCIEAAMFTAAAILLTLSKSKPTVTVRKINKNNLILSLFIWFLTFAGGILAALWVEKGLTALGVSAPSIRVDGWFIIPAVLLTCLVAPFCEETVFRSALVSGLKSRFGYVATVILSALAFALMHMNAFQFVFQLYLGVSFGIVAYRTQNLTYTLIMHAVGNLCALLISFVPFSLVDAWWTIIPAVLLVPSTLWGIIKLSYGLKDDLCAGEEKETCAVKETDNIGLVPYCLAIVVCALVFAAGFLSFGA